MNAIKLWWFRWFCVIPVWKALAWDLIWKRNVYGDEINHINCRSVWVDKKNRSYRVEELNYNP